MSVFLSALHPVLQSDQLPNTAKILPWQRCVGDSAPWEVVTDSVPQEAETTDPEYTHLAKCFAAKAVFTPLINLDYTLKVSLLLYIE